MRHYFTTKGQYKATHIHWSRFKQISLGKYNRVREMARKEGLPLTPYKFTYGGFVYQNSYPCSNGEKVCLRYRDEITASLYKLLKEEKEKNIAEHKEDLGYLLCIKDCHWDDAPKREEPFVTQGKQYPVIMKNEGELWFINDHDIENTWCLTDPEFKQYFEYKRPFEMEVEINKTLDDLENNRVSDLDEFLESLDESLEEKVPSEEDTKDSLEKDLYDITQEDTTNKPNKVKSDGGKSSYYQIDTPQWFVDKVSSGELMLEDLAEVIFGNDFNYTNVFKAMKRVYEAEKGCGKEGNDVKYDIKKIHYYADKIQEKANR